MNILADLLAKVQIARSHITMEGRISEKLRRIDGKLRLLLDHQLDIRAVHPAEGRLRLRQEVNLLLLRIIDVIAKRNGIRYWLMYGTLLGAVRHGGFVPWDDDLDIALLKDDYEKLRKVLPSALPEGLEVQWWTTPSIPRLGIMRVVDRATGCFVDIYPHLKVPGALNASGVKTDWEQSYLAFMAKRNKPGAYRPLTDRDRDEIQVWIEGHQTGDGDRTGVSVSPEYTTSPPLYWRTYFADDVFPLQDISFEGFDFPAPVHSRAILECIYDTFEKFPSDAGSGHSGDVLNGPDSQLLRKSIDRLHSSLDNLLGD